MATIILLIVLQTVAVIKTGSTGILIQKMNMIVIKKKHGSNWRMAAGDVCGLHRSEIQEDVWGEEKTNGD